MPTVSLADITPAIALGPLDGRYRKDTADLVDHLSEAALNRNRIAVEIEWFIHLAQNHVIESVRRLTPEEVDGLRAFAALALPHTTPPPPPAPAATFPAVTGAHTPARAAVGGGGPDALTALVLSCGPSETTNPPAWPLGITGAPIRRATRSLAVDLQ